MTDPTPQTPAPASAAEVLDVLTRLQQATRAYRESSTVDALDAQDVVNEIEMELGELLCPLDGSPDFDLADLAAAQPAPAPAGVMREALSPEAAALYLRERMAGMGYTSPVQAGLSIAISEARFGLRTVDHPGKWEAMAQRIEMVGEVAAQMVQSAQYPTPPAAGAGAQAEALLREWGQAIQSGDQRRQFAAEQALRRAALAQAQAEGGEASG